MSAIQNNPQPTFTPVSPPVSPPSVTSTQTSTQTSTETPTVGSTTIRPTAPTSSPPNIPTERVESDIDQAFQNGETLENSGELSSRFQTVQGILPQLGGETAPLTHGGGINDSGLGLNSSQHQALRSASGPIPSEAWQNPADIVGRLTQTPANGSHGNSSIRCGPSALLGSALMQGPQQAAHFLDSVANSNTGGRLSSSQVQELRTTAQGLRSGNVSYEQLSQAQNLLYRAGNSRGGLDEFINQTIERMPSGTDRTQLEGLRTQLQNGAWTDTQARQAETIMSRATGHNVAIRLVDDPQHPGDANHQFYSLAVQGSQARRERSGFDDSEVESLSQMGGANTRVIRPNMSATLQSLFSEIRPGESMSVRVAADSGGITNQNNNSNHFISLGRQQDGTPYIYNPFPTQGDHTLFTGSRQEPQPTSFTDQLSRYQDRFILDQDNDMPNATVTRFSQ